MKSKSPGTRLPAKLVSPDTGQAVLRTRLFDLIDTHPTASIWIHGPPGSGKTTLTATYLHAKKLRPIWFQVDADDAEPSTFFHFLSMAVKAAIPARHLLPVIDIENREDWTGFARRFFRTMLVGLAKHDVLVFENIHEAKGALDALLQLLAAEAGTQQRIIFTSHHRPPAAFADAFVKRHLAALNADTLRFDVVEIDALLGRSAGATLQSHDIARVRMLTGGWAAGIVLLRSQAMAELGDSDFQPESRLRLFEYFSQVVIGKLPTETRELLTACAFLPDFDASLAITASGNPQAGDLLDDLFRNGLFVERRVTGKVAIFRLHNLLAEALRDRVGSQGSGARKLALVRAGHLLADCGRVEASIALLLDGGDARAAAVYILQIAESIIGQSRLEQLAGLIAGLPLQLRAGLPWLDYWLGLCLSTVDECAARRVLADVHLRFEQHGDQLGCVLSAAAMVSCIESGWQDYQGFDRWIAALNLHWSSGLSFPTAASELRAAIGLLASRFGGVQREAAFADLRNRIGELIGAVKDANAQLSAAALTIKSFIDDRTHERALFFENFIHLNVRMEQASPSSIAKWYLTLSTVHVEGAAGLRRPELLDSARKHHATAVLIANTHALSAIKISLAHAEATRCSWARDIVGMKQALDSVESEIHPGRARQLIWQLSRRATLGMLSHEPDNAWHTISRVIELANEAHFPDRSSSIYYIMAANALLLLRRYDEARQHYEYAMPRTTIRNWRICELSIIFLAALHAMEQTDSGDALDKIPIANFFTALEKNQSLEFGRMFDLILARLCANALSHGIECEFVRKLVLFRKFLPPPGAPANWPWPLRIEALGDFKVVVEDKLLAFEGKGQKKPLELLKFIVCSQASAHDNAGPSVKRVIDELWPDMEAKDPQGSFEIALHRLRKLIGVENVVVLSDGRVSLNSELIWCDVAAFETSARSERFDDVLHATALYTGPLLGSSAHVWAAVPRERLAAKFSALVDLCARQMESDGDYPAAIALYERALQQDNLIEAFYRGQMRCYEACGAITEAKRVYRRCKELLSIVLGAKPAAETEALNARIAD